MTGPIDMNGVSIILDADGDTTLDASVDDTVTLNIGGTPVVFSTDIDVGGLDISNLPAVPAG